MFSKLKKIGRISRESGRIVAAYTAGLLTIVSLAYAASGATTLSPGAILTAANWNAVVTQVNKIGTISPGKNCVANADGSGFDCAADLAAPAGAEVDPKIGSLTEGKWCKSAGGKVECASDAPGGATISHYGYHTNDCTGTDIFVPMNGGATPALGLCFDFAERNAQIWTTAWETCLYYGKRLPDYAEWVKACNSPDSKEMKGNWEWAQSNPNGYLGATATVAGNTNCSSVSNRYVLADGGTTDTAYFHCAR